MRTGHYLRLLNRIQLYLLPRTYVEIGVWRGKSLALALPGTRSIGIDPAAEIVYPVDRSAKIFSMKSDDFFASRDLIRELGGLPVDLAFIDGLHLFEFALRDFINLEKRCTPQSIILVHDCYPIDAHSAERARTTSKWSGDVWKLIVCLQELRPDLHLATVDVPPTGLGIISNLDPASTVLAERYDGILEKFGSIRFEAIESTIDAILNRVPDDWDEVRSVLPAQPFRNERAIRLRLGRSVRRPTHERLALELERRVGLSSLGALLRAVRARSTVAASVLEAARRRG